MIIDAKTEDLIDQYKYPGFYPNQKILVSPKDPGARIITLIRRSKKQYVADVKQSIRAGMISEFAMFEILGVAKPEFFLQ